MTEDDGNGLRLQVRDQEKESEWVNKREEQQIWCWARSEMWTKRTKWTIYSQKRVRDRVREWVRESSKVDMATSASTRDLSDRTGLIISRQREKYSSVTLKVIHLVLTLNRSDLIEKERRRNQSAFHPYSLPLPPSPSLLFFQERWRENFVYILLSGFEILLLSLPLFPGGRFKTPFRRFLFRYFLEFSFCFSCFFLIFPFSFFLFHLLPFLASFTPPFTASYFWLLKFL